VKANSKVWFWANYTALVLLVIGFNWWLTLVRSDKTYPEEFTQPLQAFSLFLYGVLMALMGDFETEAAKTKGLKRYVLNVLEPCLKSPFGLFLPVFLSVILIFLFTNSRSMRIQIAALKELRSLRAYLASKENNETEITGAISDDHVWLQTLGSDPSSPKLILTDEYGFRRMEAILPKAFRYSDFLTGRATDPTNGMDDFDAIKSPISVEITYQNKMGEVQSLLDAQINPTSPNLQELIDQDTIPKSVFIRASEEVQKKNKEREIPTHINPPAPFKQLTIPVRSNDYKFKIDSGDNSYYVTYKYDVSKLLIRQEDTGSLTRSGRNKLINQLEKLALKNGDAEYDNLELEFGKLTGIDRRLLWWGLFQVLEDNEYFNSSYDEQKKGFARVVSLFLANSDWLDEKTVHPFFEHAKEWLKNGMLDARCRTVLLIGLIRVAVFGQNPILMVEALQESKDAVSNSDGDANLLNAVVADFEDKRALGRMYDCAPESLCDCVRVLSDKAGPEIRPRLKDVQDSLTAKGKIFEGLKKITASATSEGS
jgi:hypothetical protein